LSKLFQYSEKKTFALVQDLVIREHVEAFVFVLQLRSGRLMSQCALMYCVGANDNHSSFGGLVVSMLASGTQDRGFEPGQSRQIFRAKKSTAFLPSEGK
jgi:hypothetical protein